jgi:hypothetical protein
MSMTLVSTVTVGAGGAANITFSSIPQTGTDLLLVLSGRVSGSSGDAKITFNSSTTGYTGRYLLGSGSAASSDLLAQVAGSLPGTARTANTFGSIQIYIPNYAGSTNKSYSVDEVEENNATLAYLMIAAGLWANTSAITSIVLTDFSAGNFVQHSTASLYLITKGSGGATTSP